MILGIMERYSCYLQYPKDTVGLTAHLILMRFIKIFTYLKGEVQQSSNIYGPDVPAVDHRQGTFAYYNNSGAFSWANYSFSTVLRSTDDNGICLMFRYQNANNYYKLDLDKQRNFHKLFKVVNGVGATLANADQGISRAPIPTWKSRLWATRSRCSRTKSMCLVSQSRIVPFRPAQ